MALDEFPRFLAGQPRKRSSKHDPQAGKCGLPGRFPDRRHPRAPKILELAPIRFIGEEPGDRPGNLLPHLVHLEELFPGGGAERFQRAVARRQHPRHVLADVGDPEREKKPVEPHRPALVQFAEQVRGRFLGEGPPHPLGQTEQVSLRQSEEVRRAPHPAGAHQISRHRFTQPRKVEGVFPRHPGDSGGEGVLLPAEGLVPVPAPRLTPRPAPENPDLEEIGNQRAFRRRGERLQRLVGARPRFRVGETFGVQHERRQILEAVGHLLCPRRADSGKAQRHQDPRERHVPNRPEAADERLGSRVIEGASGGLGRHREQLLPGQPIEIGRRLHEPALDEEFHEFIAERLDFHGALADEVDETGLPLRRTTPTSRTEMVGALRQHGSPALRASDRHGPGDAFRSPDAGDDFHDLRDHVAGALDFHAVAGLRIERPDHSLVVQGGAAHGDAGHQNRFQPRHRGQLSGPTHLDDNTDERRLGLPRRELEGDRPARVSGSFSQLALVGQPVQLHHRPVKFDLKPVAPLDEEAMVGEHLTRPAPDFPPDGPSSRPRCTLRSSLRRHPESEIGEGPEHPRLGSGRRELGVLPNQDVVGVECEGPGGRDPRVQLAERARGSIPRVLEGVLPGALQSLVHPLEVGHRQHHLAAHRKALRRPLPRQPERQRSDGPQVGGDVLPDLAVPAGRSPNERPPLVDEFHREPVVLGLEAVFEVLPADLPFHPVGELAKFVLVVDALEREHGRLVPDLRKSLGHRASDPLSRGLRGHEFRVVPLESFQFPKERVVVAVVDCR